MDCRNKTILGREEITKISSVYLNEGRSQDKWEILHVEIEDGTLDARLKMQSYYVSQTDPGGFHLPMYPSLEFVSQLMIIYAHVWAGFPEKNKEAWMLETSFTGKRPIRDPENIQVHMKVSLIKKIKGNVLMVAESKVFDKEGLFEIRIKGFLS